MMNEQELRNVIQQVFIEDVQAVEQARTNPQTVNYLVGKVMQKTRGQADPALTLEIIRSSI